MPDVPRSTLALYAAAAVLVAVVGWRATGGGKGGEAEPAGRPVGAVRVERASRGGAVVHVAGAVRRPGVYRLPAGARVDDAVQRAGGATGRADLGAVNLAAEVDDGRQVLVPERAATPAAAASAPAGGATSGAAPAAPAARLDLNRATLADLDALDGIGPALAQRILDHRTEHGGFGSVDELAQVPGIGAKRLAALREQVRV